jgi:hypothetical protein
VGPLPASLLDLGPLPDQLPATRQERLAASSAREGVKEFMAQKIIERVEAHYESREVPFGKVYEWHNAYVALECDCGEKVTLSATSTTTTCSRCGTDLGGFVHDIQEREGRLPDNLTHPWFYDAQLRADQRLRDEAAYPKGSPWRYDDITAGP